jgi:hypothetical protein
MNTLDILRLANKFYVMAKGETLPADSKDTDTILKNIENLETYAARIKYAEKNLDHLSSGSSRIVYTLPDGTILKLAKNDRGLAQNKAEGNPEMKSPYLNKLLRAAKNRAWINMQFLDKITEKEFEEMTDVDFKDFGDAIRYGLKDVSDNSEEKPKNFEEISKTKVYKELYNVGKEFKLMPGDIARISSWGCKDNHPVLIDAGLTKEIFDKYYDSGTTDRSSESSV